MSFIHTTLTWIANNKLIFFLSSTSFIFFVCTVSLGTQVTYLNDEVKFYRTLNITSKTDNIIPTVSPTIPPTEGTTMQPTPNPNPDKDWRLPGNVEPISYDLTLKPNLDDGTFEGSVVIKFETKFTLNVIKLNTNGLKVNEMIIKMNDNLLLRCTEEGEVVKEILALRCEGFGGSSLYPGEHVSNVTFSGNMTNKIVGLYRSSYINEKGETRYIATSKLEPTYARQVFPCFDEPNYKAKYTIHLQIPKNDGYIALSNMNQNGEPVPIPGDDKHLMVHFNTSEAMPTYVSCFIVCDFNYTEATITSTSGQDISLKVYATPAQVAKTEYALGIAKKVFKYYEDYFDMEYPLSKLDMIAIPDFVSGATEHWGIVTYSETALLYNKSTSNTDNKQRIATVVAHELAHMWFGNLVTLEWWSDLWLFEGFATFMQFKVINDVTPEWKMADQFLIDQLHSVLDFDSTLATHPLVVTVNTPDQITEIFDKISYNKGASLLRMLENAIGEEKFKEGIQKYLKAHQNGNSVTKDLWKELQNTEPKFNVQEVMDTWTVQSGYPVIKVTKGTGNYYNLEQKRFLIKSADDYKWTIPIVYFTDQDSENVNLTWINKTDLITKIQVPENTKWLKLNYQQIGYYRVNYDDSLWESLTKNFKNFTASDKANLLDDSFSIAKAGELEYGIPLDIIKQMIDETEYIPWTVTIRKFNELKPLLKSDPDVYRKFQQYVLSKLEKIYKTHGWETKDKSKDHLDRLLRAKILHAACAYGNKYCTKIATEKFETWLKTREVDLDEKEIVFEFGMELASEETWDKVFAIYKEENDAAEKLKLLKGLASVKNRELLNILLKQAENETIVRSQDYLTCLNYISSNDYGTDIVWDYVGEHWEDLVERFTLNDRYLGRLIPSITSSFVTQTKLEDVESFFKKYPEAGAGETSRKEALEQVKNNIKWINEYQNSLVNLLP